VIRERVVVGRTSTLVASARHDGGGVLVENAGATDVFIDSTPHALEDDGIEQSGFRVGPGERVTFPAAQVWAASGGDVGELTAHVPGMEASW
jgi:hypothetical protein